MTKVKPKVQVSNFQAKVYKVTITTVFNKKTKKDEDKLYVYYEWRKHSHHQWTKLDKKGKPFYWIVPDTPRGNACYDKWQEKITKIETLEIEDGFEVYPPVEFDVIMEQRDRPGYPDEYTWRHTTRITPVPNQSVSTFPVNFSYD